jgi:hypothetical protein
MTSLHPRAAVLLMLVRFRKDFRVLRVPAQGRRERSSQFFDEGSALRGALAPSRITGFRL